MILVLLYSQLKCDLVKKKIWYLLNSTKFIFLRQLTGQVCRLWIINLMAEHVFFFTSIIRKINGCFSPHWHILDIHRTYPSITRLTPISLVKYNYGPLFFNKIFYIWVNFRCVSQILISSWYLREVSVSNHPFIFKSSKESPLFENFPFQQIFCCW